ncbi:hypothetical protein [Bacteroides acidifaciens]|uniref:hypothetical protein n=1 Tax=Bacteroides acidifaciens TaxID=85831 RepID=UPI002557FA14|nr:hypothetical protein [Bacteroides acidifaciens]
MAWLLSGRGAIVMIISLSCKLTLSDLLGVCETVATVGALILSIFTFVKSTKDSNKERHSQTLLELYRLGNTFTSNMNGFDQETGTLVNEIRSGISISEFDKLYHSGDYEPLRTAISYFDFLEKMIEDGSISKSDCYKVVSFPKNLYLNFEELFAYAKANRFHEFDYFEAFCLGYIDEMKKMVSQGVGVGGI